MPGDRRPDDKVGTDESVAGDHRYALIVFSAGTGRVEDVLLAEGADSWSSKSHTLDFVGGVRGVLLGADARAVWRSAVYDGVEGVDIGAFRLDSSAFTVLKREGGKLSRLLSKIGAQLMHAVDELPDDDVTVLADRIASVLPSEPAAGAEAIGPIFETADLTEWRGVSKQAIDNQRRRHSILALRTSDGAWVYPEWQFDEHGNVRKGVGESVKALSAGGMDPWTQAVWFRGASPDLEDETAAGWLRSGKDPEAVVQLARRTGNRWRQ